MTSRTPTEQAHDPVFREINLSAEIKRMYGVKWNEPELAYVFSNDRKFYLRTEDAGIYQSQVSAIGALLKEDGGHLLKEDGGQLLLG